MKKIKQLLSFLTAICVVMTSVVIFSQPEVFAGNGTYCSISPLSGTYDRKNGGTITFTLESRASISGKISGYSVTATRSSFSFSIDNVSKSINASSTTKGTVTVNVRDYSVGTHNTKFTNTYTSTNYAAQLLLGNTFNDEATGTFTITCTHNYNSQTTTSTYLKSAATCTSPAVYYYKCAYCDAKGSSTYTSGSTAAHNYTSTSTDSSHLKSAATCTSPAVYYKSCTVCGANDTSNTFTSGSSLGHSFTSQTKTSTYLKTAATCTADAVYYYKCSRCSTSSQGNTNTTYTDTGSMLAHTPGDWVTLTPATCTSAGSKEKRCTVCNTLLATDTIPATGHTEVIDPAVAATCTETGLTQGSHCSVCNAVIVAQETVPALGHVEAEWAVATAATCTEAGLKTKTCSRCSVVYASEVIPANGHTPVTDAAVAPTCTETGLTEGSHCSVCNTVLVAQETVAALGHNYVATVTAPTCTQAGYTTYTCSRCGDSYVDDNTEVLGHTWNEGVVTTEPTCTETGIRTFTCTVCGTTKTETEPANGHTPVTDPAVAPTCSATGLTQGSHCSVCNAVLVAQETVAIDPDAHTYGEWTVTTPATCSATGVETRVCSRDAEHTETRTLAIDPNAHSWDEGTVTVPATCTDDGVKTYTCQHNAEHTRTEVIPATGHSYEWVVTTPATCTATGIESYKCSVCNDISDTRVISALGHDYIQDPTDDFLKTPATCIAPAEYYYKCSRCNRSSEGDTDATYTYGAADPTAHNWGEGEVTTAPTCSATGIRTFTCSICHNTKQETEPIDPNAHSWGEWIVTTPATCVAAGVETSTCANDSSHTQTREVPVNPVAHNYQKTSTVAPTCTVDGYDLYTCANGCGSTEHRNIVTAPGHNYTSEVTTAPGCATEGVRTYTCSRCGDSYTEAITANGHTWDAGTVTTAATCMQAGVMTYTCTVCGATTTDVIPIDSNAHNWGAWTTTTAATCTTAGEEERVCTLNSAHTETRSIPIDNDAHDWGDWVETTPATCTATGVETRTCRHNAEHTQTRDIPIDSSNHNYQLTGTVQPTCTEGGYDIYTCSRCGDVQHQNPTAATGHSYTVEDPSPAFLRTAATCTDAATYYKKCANCGASSHSDGTDTYFTYGSVNASNHDYQFTRTVAPTCTAQGYDLYTCANGCGSTEQRNLVVANGHTFTVQDHTSEFLRTEATCQAAATYYYKCSVCGVSSHDATGDDSYYSYGEVNPTAHDFQFTETVAPTCTEDGYDLYTCSRCPATEHRNTTSALGHNFVFTRTVAPTCLEGGYDIYTCSRCDATENRNLTSATGHSWGEWEVTTAPGCLTDGEETRVCNNDNSHTETRTVEALGHDYVGTITTQPTCTLAGEKTYECSRCDASYTESVAALGHDYEDVVTPPTCTEDGYTTHTCSRCDASYIDTTVAATGHDFQKTSTVPPTCTEGGYDVYTCANGCGATENRNSVAATGHAWGEWTQTVAPTCTEAGSETRVCANDNSHTETQAVAALGHDITGVEWTVVTPPTTSSTGLKVKYCTRCGAVVEEEVIPVLTGPAVEDLEIYPDGGSVLIGGTLQLTPVITPANATNKNVLWYSSDNTVALVSSSGLVTGVAAGTVTITAKAQDNQTITDTVTITVVSTIAQVGYIRHGRHYNGITSGAAAYITPDSCTTLQYQTTYTPSEYTGNGATLTPTLAFYSVSDGATPVTMPSGTKITLIDYTLTGAPKYYYYMCGGSETSLPITSFTRMQYLTPFAVKTSSSQITEKLIFVVDYADATTTPSSLSPKLHYNFTTD